MTDLTTDLAVTALAVTALALAPARGSAQGPTRRVPFQVEREFPHVPNRPHAIALEEGDRLVAGTCGVGAGRRVGDTTLRLLDPWGVRVAFNGDACGSLGSYLEYRVPPGRGGTHVLIPGCDGPSSCGGVVAYTVTGLGARRQASRRARPPREASPPRGAPPREPPTFRLRLAARGLLSFDQPGGGLLGDAVLEYRPVELLVLRLSGAPLGLAGGDAGGMFGGSGHLQALLDLGPVAFGAGGGVATVSRRFETVDAVEIGVFVARLRVGERFDGFSLFGQLSLGDLEGAEIVSAEVGMRLAFHEADLTARALMGDDGVVLAELAATVWVHADTQPRLGISMHAGVGGVFYEPACRFGRSCDGEHWYVGPSLGAGLEWRP